MKIKQLEIQNVGNIGSVKYDLSNVNIWSADNGVGKSNTINSLSYLLSKRIMSDGSVGENDFYQLIPNDDQTKVCSVTITTETNTTFGFKHYNKFTKKRGSTETVFDGRVTDWYYNGVKCKNIAEFNSEFYRVFGLEKLKDITVNDSKFNPLALITDVFYAFNKIDYKILRELVIHFTGDVTFNDLVNSYPEFNNLKDDNIKYGGRIDLARKNYKSMYLDLQKQVEIKQGVIDAFNVGQFNQDELNKLNEEKNSLLSLKNNETGKAKEYLMNLEIKLEELSSKYVQSKSNDQLQNSNQVLVLGKKVSELKDTLQTYQVSVTKLENDLNVFRERGRTNKHSDEIYKEQIDHLYLELNELVNNPPKAMTCPECGHEFNDSSDYIESVKKHKEKIEKIKLQIADYNSKRNANIEATKSLLIDIKKVNDALVESTRELEKVKAEYDRVNNSYLMAQQEQNSYISENTKALKTEYENMQKELDLSKKNYSEFINTINGRFDEQLNQCELEINKLLEIKYSIDKKAQLEKEKELLVYQLNNAESMFYLCDKYIKLRIKTISDKTKDTFGIQFQMLEEQVNGGLAEVCYPVVEGKSYTQLNRGMKETIGAKFIKAIETLSNIDEFPILIDNAESLSNRTILNLEKLNNQLFLTKVSNDHEINFESRL